MSFELTYDAIAKRIDHSLLGPTLSDRGARRGCRLAVALRRGQRLHQAVRAWRWPRGFSRARAWRSERRSASRTAVMRRRSRSSKRDEAMADGATELDMVINIGQAMGGEWDAVAADIAAVTKAAHDGGAIVKVIFENCYLERRAESATLPDLRRGRRRLRQDLDGLRHGRRHDGRPAPDAAGGAAARQAQGGRWRPHARCDDRGRRARLRPDRRSRTAEILDELKTPA